jgi:hypothetical protein
MIGKIILSAITAYKSRSFTGWTGERGIVKYPAL